LLKDRIFLHAAEDWIKAILQESSKSSIIGHITFCITINGFRKVTGKKADLIAEVSTALRFKATIKCYGLYFKFSSKDVRSVI